MISSIFEHMRSWVRETLGDVDVTLDPPSGGSNIRSTSLYLKDISESPGIGPTLKRDRLQVQLTFLVTTTGKSLLEADEDLAKLAFAAMLEKDMEIDLSPLPPEGWRAFGLVPRPSFFLNIPLNFEVDKPEAKRVTKPHVLTTSPLPDKKQTLKKKPPGKG